jgi:hypothetical protein
MKKSAPLFAFVIAAGTTIALAQGVPPADFPSVHPPEGKYDIVYDDSTTGAIGFGPDSGGYNYQEGPYVFWTLPIDPPPGYEVRDDNGVLEFYLYFVPADPSPPDYHVFKVDAVTGAWTHGTATRRP